MKPPERRIFPFRGPLKKFEDARRAAVTEQKANEAEGEKTGYIYSWKDSPAHNEEGGYNVTFADLIKQLVPRRRDYIQGIQDLLKAAPKKDRIALDIGGPGNEFFSAFSDGFFSKTAGLSLETFNAASSDTHTVVDGVDAYSSELIKKIDAFRDGKPITLSVSRMARGLDHAPENPMPALKNLDELYKRHGTPSLILIQVPVEYRSIMDTWAARVQQNPDPALRIIARKSAHYARNSQGNAGCPAIAILKLPGAPDHLPALSPREIYRPKTITRKQNDAGQFFN